MSKSKSTRLGDGPGLCVNVRASGIEAGAEAGILDRALPKRLGLPGSLKRVGLGLRIVRKPKEGGLRFRVLQGFRVAV